MRVVGRPSDKSRRLALLRRLTPQQRGHFDMKHGFGPVAAPPAVPTEQGALFDGLDREVVLGLRGGFGKDLLRRMEDAREHLTERDFASLGDGVVTELRGLLATLASVI